MEEKKLYNAVRKTITLADGREIMIETGKLAKQADGSVVVKMGDTMLLGTVVAAKDAKPDTDFMPLQVEYKEKYAACGRYPGGFMKREGKANDSEILVARLIDRALRPLFPSDYHAEVYVTVNLISADKDIQPDALAASAALAVSDIPFGGPISEVRVARIGGQYVINPAFSQMQDADLDIMVGGTIDNILMVEGEMKEVSEEVMLGAIKFAHEEIKKHCAVQIELSKELGKDVKRTYCHEVNDEELRQTIIRELYDKAYAIATSGTMKHEREDAFNALEAEFATRFSEEELVEKAPLIHKYFHDDVQKKAMRNMILDEGKRLDGRRTDEIRPIWCEVGYLPAAHGSAIFTRGETQSLTTVTLGTKMDEKVKDEVLVQGTEQFVLHYNFPPFSTGEAAGVLHSGFGGGFAPGRHRPRQPRLARPQTDGSRRRGKSLCRACGVGYSRVERLVVDGDGLCRYAGADGCRRETQETRFGYRHGSDFGFRYRSLGGAFRHPGR